MGGTIAQDRGPIFLYDPTAGFVLVADRDFPTLFGLDTDFYRVGKQHLNATNDGNWHHIVGVWAAPPGSSTAADQFILYVDGYKVGVTHLIDTSTPRTSPLTGYGPLLI